MGCSLGFPPFLSSRIQLSLRPCDFVLLFTPLSSGLLSAARVVFVVVLSFHLLVTEEVAPPAFRVVHLTGRPSALHLPHLLKHKLITFLFIICIP